MKPIYEPKGRAKEYGDLCVNIYTGCPHRCFYCFAPNVLRKDREEFHSLVAPRKNIVEATRRQIEQEKIKEKLIHLCFTCDPYPTGYNTTATREIIKIIKNSGNHVQILTKGNGQRDFDILDKNDWYGITIDGTNSIGFETIKSLVLANENGIKTWVSFEPVINTANVLFDIEALSEYTDKVMIGKLNYHKSNINWSAFGKEAESLCQQLGLNYYIKNDLRQEMEGAVKNDSKTTH